MEQSAPKPALGLLASGGLDSSILLTSLLADGHRIQPFYISSGLVWQQCELDRLRRFLQAVQTSLLSPLVVLELPLADIYGPSHWSVSGQGVPGMGTPDEAVYLPGRNPLLVIKAALWCHLNGLDQLALAPLAGNPFADATSTFFEQFATVLNRATLGGIRIIRPFCHMSKAQVMQLGHGYPLELTFSCLKPRSKRHCGRCNKCSERRQAFQAAGMPDPTPYARNPDWAAVR